MINPWGFCNSAIVFAGFSYLYYHLNSFQSLLSCLPQDQLNHSPFCFTHAPLRSLEAFSVTSTSLVVYPCSICALGHFLLIIICWPSQLVDALWPLYPPTGVSTALLLSYAFIASIYGFYASYLSSLPHPSCHFYCISLSDCPFCPLLKGSPTWSPTHLYTMASSHPTLF